MRRYGSLFSCVVVLWNKICGGFSSRVCYFEEGDIWKFAMSFGIVATVFDGFSLLILRKSLL